MILKPNAHDQTLADNWALTVDAVFHLIAEALATSDQAEVARLHRVAQSQLAVCHMLSSTLRRSFEMAAERATMGRDGAAAVGVQLPCAPARGA